GLDALNTPVTILSTSTPIGRLPLAAILTSDETTSTFTKALNMLKNVLLLTAFNGRGPVVGPQIFMTDDCKAERTALNNTWDKSDGKHGIDKGDRVVLIEHLKKIVFAKNETILEEARTALISSQVYLKYPHFQKHFKALWDRRGEWAIAFRQKLLIRNNHTNNFSEAGIRTMDLYYTRKLLAVAHNRVDNFVALRFQLSGWKIRSIDNIKIISHESMIYEHQSSKNPDLWYLVDMQLGICECNLTGAPCKHQTSIAIHYRICGLNQLPTMSADSRHNYAYLG
ncbi:255_t:CDS:2, partial [Gigaspora margarita]